MPSIVYRFVEEGADSVARAFSTVKRSAEEAARAQRSSRSRGPQTAAAQETRHEAAEQRKRDRAFEASERHRVKVQERNARYLERVRTNSMLRQQRMEEKQIAQRLRAEQAIVRKQAQAMQARRQHASRTQAAFVGALGANAYGKALEVAGNVVQIGGSAVRRELDLKRQASALSVSGRGAGQAGVDPALLQAEAHAAARAVKGTRPEDILEAQSKYVAMTGDLNGARGLASTFANASAATGAKGEDIASMAATLQQKFGIKDPKEMQAAIADAIFQGKSGSFELSDAASYYSEMGAAGSRFGLDKGAGGAKKLGALAQIAKSSTGSGAEASTAVQAMLSDIVSHSKQIKLKTGTDVFTDKTGTKTRDIEDILAGIVKGSKGDQRKLNDIFGERGMRGISSLIEAFNEGTKSAAKNATEAERLAAGEAALRKMFDETVSAGGDWSEVLKDAETNTSNLDASLESAWGTFTNTLGDAVMPGLESMAQHADAFGAVLEPLAIMAGDVVDAFADVVKTLQDAGVLAKAPGANDKSANARGDLKDVQSKLGELDALKKTGGGLTAAQRAERRRLVERQVSLRQQVADLPALYVGTGDATGGGTAEDQLGMTANVPQQGKGSGADNSYTQAINKNRMSMWTAAASFVAQPGAATAGIAAGLAVWSHTGSSQTPAQATGSGIDAAREQLASGQKLAEAAGKLASAADKLMRTPAMPGLPIGLFVQ